MDESLTLISTILAIFASIYTIYAYYPSKVKNTMDMLEKNPETRKHQIELLNIEKGFYKNYKNILKKILNFLDNIFDKPYKNNSKIFKFFSNLSIHYTLSLLYTFIVFIFFWLFGGSGEIGFIKILPDTNTTSFFGKTTAIFLIFLISFISYFFMKNHSLSLTKIESFFIKKIEKLYPNIALLIYRMLSVFIGITILYNFNFNFYYILLFSVVSYFYPIYVLLFGIIGGIVKGLGFGFGVGLGLVGALGFGLRIGLIVVAMGGLGIYVGILTLFNNEGFWNNFNITMLLFFFILPLINSILDYLSLKVSRYFAKKIYSDTNWYVLLHILADIFLAIFFLVTLYLLIFYSFSYKYFRR